MGSGDRTADLIGSTYEAVADASRWPAVLSGLKDLADGIGAVLLSIDTKSGDGRMVASVDLDLQYLQTFAAHYHAVDPWIEPVLRQSLGQIVPTERHVPHGELVRTEFYNDWLRPQGIERSLGCVMLREDGELVVLGLPRGAKQDPYQRGDITPLRPLTRHVQRALQLDWRLGRSDVVRRTAFAALERIATGAFVADESFRIVPINPAAEAIARSGDGLHWRNGRLRAQRASDQRKLDRLIGEAVGATDGGGLGTDGMMSLPRPSGRLPYAVFVAPLPKEPGGPLAGHACAALLIADPERDTGAAPGGLARLYGLTPAEARLAERLMSGDRLYAAADALGVTRETARNHLKQIFSKTDTHRQAELIRLLLASGLGAPGRPPEGGG